LQSQVADFSVAQWPGRFGARGVPPCFSIPVLCHAGIRSFSVPLAGRLRKVRFRYVVPNQGVVAENAREKCPIRSRSLGDRDACPLRTGAKHCGSRLNGAEVRHLRVRSRTPECDVRHTSRNTRGRRASELALARSLADSLGDRVCQSTKEHPRGALTTSHEKSESRNVRCG
jgi:hypothetical protein